MKKKDNFKRAVQGETKQEDEIEEFTPETQKRKSQEQLLTVVDDFMMDEIELSLGTAADSIRTAIEDKLGVLIRFHWRFLFPFSIKHDSPFMTSHW